MTWSNIIFIWSKCRTYIGGYGCQSFKLSGKWINFGKENYSVIKNKKKIRSVKNSINYKNSKNDAKEREIWPRERFSNHPKKSAKWFENLIRGKGNHQIDI